MGIAERLDPANNVRMNHGAIDVGDRASTYVFDNTGASFSVALLGGGDDARKQLSALAATGDDKWGPNYTPEDGQSKSRLDITDADGNVADDLLALMAAAVAGEGDLKIVTNSVGQVVIEVAGRWSNDLLVFNGDLAKQLFASTLDGKTDIKDKNSTTNIFDYGDWDVNANGNGGQKFFHGSDGDLSSEGKAFISGSSLGENEVKGFVHTILDDYNGFNQVGPEGEFVVTELTDTSMTVEIFNGRATDTITLVGEAVEMAIASYAPPTCVYESAGTQNVEKDIANALIVPNDFGGLSGVPNLQLEDFTVSFTFKLDALVGGTFGQGLLSKDHTNDGNGGHTYVYAQGDDIKLRYQDQTGGASQIDKVIALDVLNTADEFDFGIVFNNGTIKSYLNGGLIDTTDVSGFTDQNWQDNAEALIFGASNAFSAVGTTNDVRNPLNGSIGNICVYDAVLDDGGIAMIHAQSGSLFI